MDELNVAASPWPKGLPLRLLIVQPSPFCNLDCSYCYLPNRSDKSRMAISTLRRLLARVFDEALADNEFSLVWHAGEPLAVPLAWYREATAAIADECPSHATIIQSIQTNGTLIDEAWCRWFRDEGVRVGVSVDGPEALHDRHRKTRAGRGTWNATMRGIEILRRAEIPFHVITVLTRESLDDPDALYGFYLQNGIHQVGFNFEEVEGINRQTSLAGNEVRPVLDAFLSRFFHLMMESNGAFVVRELAAALNAIRNPLGEEELNPQAIPGYITSIDWEGNFTTFSPELLGMRDERFGDFTFGNVFEHALSDMAWNSKYQQVWNEISLGVERCRRDCSYFSVCGGGAPSNKLYENGRFDTTETLHCRYTNQATVNVAMRELEEALGLKAGRA
jgi:uncharacterized protein